MKTTFSLIFTLFFHLHCTGQDFSSLNFGTNDSFEVMTWNIESFPKNGITTINYVTQIVNALDVDVIVIQEVQDENAFMQLLNNLPNYYGNLESTNYDGLALLFKYDTVRVNYIYRIFNTSAYWNAFPRAPMVIQLTYNNQEFYIINNHLKCCGDGILNLANSNDEETRRYQAINLLKSYIDTNLNNKNVIVLGDFNDELTDNVANNVFRNLLNDYENYKFTDYSIAQGNSANWSYPSWPSHLDHILITNELFDEFNLPSSQIDVIPIENAFSGGWNEYDQNISDHRPVALKLVIDTNLSISNQKNSVFKMYPNPAKSVVNFILKQNISKANLVVTNYLGQEIFSDILSISKDKILYNIEHLSSCVYYVTLSSGQYKTTKKLVVTK